MGQHGPPLGCRMVLEQAGPECGRMSSTWLAENWMRARSCALRDGKPFRVSQTRAGFRRGRDPGKADGKPGSADRRQRRDTVALSIPANRISLPALRATKAIASKSTIGRRQAFLQRAKGWTVLTALGIVFGVGSVISAVARCRGEGRIPAPSSNWGAQHPGLRCLRPG